MTRRSPEEGLDYVDFGSPPNTDENVPTHDTDEATDTKRFALSPEYTANIVDFNAIQARRECVGTWLGIIGLLLVVGVLGVGTYHVATWKPEPFNEWELYGAVIHLVAHGVVSVGAVWFGYQLIRAAERMYIPLHLAPEARDLLGTSSPLKQLQQLVKSLDSRRRD